MNILFPNRIQSPLICCPCSNLATENIFAKIRDPNYLKQWSDLYFCDKCSSIKCQSCTETVIISKYCPHCRHPMKYEDLHCTRSCFNCPVCTTSLSIKSHNHENDTGGLKGKSFQFTCPQGHYSYDTGLIEKPKSLLRIIKGQINEEISDLDLFDNLHHHYLTTREVLKFQKKRATLRNKRQGSPCKSDPIDHSIIRPMELAKLTTDSKLPVFNKIIIDIEENPSEIDKQYPVNQPLQTKCSVRCRKCGDFIVNLDADPNSSKFVANKLAVDMLPEINFNSINIDKDETNERKSSFKMNFINSDNKSNKITISSFDKITLSDQLHVPKSDKESYIQVSLPCTNFSIGAKPQKLSNLDLFIGTIPTSELTDYSALSRTEKMKRSVTKPTDTDKPLESGINWSAIKLNLEVHGSDKINDTVKIPLFINVQSGSTSYGYWIVTNLKIV